MNEITEFQDQFKAIINLVGFQRFLRYSLRALWLFGLAFLLTWLMNHFFGWLPSLLLRLGISTLAGAAPFIMALTARPKADQLAWSMDKRLALKEQISTALEVSRQKAPGEIAHSLLTDVNQILSRIHLRIFQRGWGFGRDLVMLLVVIIMLATMFILTLPLPSLPFPGSGGGIFPGLSSQPGKDDVFPGKVPGLAENKPESADENGTQPDAQAIFNSLADALKDDPLTQPLADAFKNMQMDQAADELDKLADALPNLPDATRQNLADAFQNAAGQLDNPDMQSLADLFEQSGDALENLPPASEQSQNTMHQLAEGLRNYGSGTPPAQTATPTPQPESNERLSGESQVFQLESSAANSDLLTPSENDPQNGQSIDSTQGGQSYAGEGVIDTLLLPEIYPWDMQWIIYDYFLP